MWEISFISEQDLTEHVEETIKKYGEKLKSYDLKRFNKNIVDPIKLIFDKSVYRTSWDEIISNEIFRQRDKSNNNDIGYFHQNIFKYMKNCRVPNNGKEGGWDVIFEDKGNITLEDGSKVSRIYVEMKNKHNTMNSASSGKTFMKMQNQLLKDDDCACFLVEAIAKKSQDIKWQPRVDGKTIGHKFIRRVSLDKFYHLVTGEEDAFYQLCMVLPTILKSVLEQMEDNVIPQDSVFEELILEAEQIQDFDNSDLSFAMAIYLLGFSNYLGFKNTK
ncbi:Eco47II family restriction endonuclease [Streptococcus uberis]|uniref:Eco47II family restriction endonuclease n=1 Tax=Streptococcus uberis TaxID=1349 RepID=UPI00193A749E|nr:Eco47II family restriction endonuclease [Streptococcus uberis]MCK1225924.1 Eco47II family restriction endonuclease [Streptococcus uberis]